MSPETKEFGRKRRRAGPLTGTTIALPAALVLLWFSSAAADRKDDLRSASDAARGTVQRALVDKDAEALASVFTEDGSVAIPTGQTIHGRTTIRSMASLMLMTWGGGNLKVSRDSLQVKDSTGYEIGRFSFRRTVKNQPDQVWAGSYTVVWEMEQGIWRMARISGLMNPPRPQGEKPRGE